MSTKCSGQLISQYKIKKTVINSLTNPHANDINKVAEDGPLLTYISYEEVESVCFDCRKRECFNGEEI